MGNPKNVQEWHDELLKLATLVMACNWKQDEFNCYTTECGHAFEFNNGTPQENGFMFCPFCGCKMEVDLFESEDSDA